jgi:ATP-dependent Clp protease ATP-binding subunit ClpA
MPKINVYLPDDLAEAVKSSGVPVSVVCQRALEQSVKRVNAIRATVLGSVGTADPIAKLSQFTDLARGVIVGGWERAKAEGAETIGTAHLLGAMLDQGSNLAVHVLRAVEIEPEAVVRRLPQGITGGSAVDRFGGDAANALELAVTEALALGHNYVGCEHLLLGLLAEPDGLGGQALRASGADLKAVRAAVVAALAGYVHLRAQAAAGPANPAALIATAVRAELAPLLGRLDRLEAAAGLDAEG